MISIPRIPRLVFHLFLSLSQQLAESVCLAYIQSARGSQVALVVKNLPANAGAARDRSWSPGSGRSPGGRRGIPLQYSCLENPTDRGAWWATIFGAAKIWTLSDLARTQALVLPEEARSGQGGRGTVIPHQQGSDFSCGTSWRRRWESWPRSTWLPISAGCPPPTP